MPLHRVTVPVRGPRIDFAALRTELDVLEVRAMTGLRGTDLTARIAWTGAGGPIAGDTGSRRAEPTGPYRPLSVYWTHREPIIPL